MVHSKVTDQHPTSSLQSTFVEIHTLQRQVILIIGFLIQCIWLILISVIWNAAQLGRYASEIDVWLLRRHMANAVLAADV